MLNNHQRDQPSPRCTFQHNHNFEDERNVESNVESICSCKACLIQQPLISKLPKLFWVGIMCPIVYFYIWGIKIYANIMYFKEIDNTNKLKKSNCEHELTTSGTSDNTNEDNLTLYSYDPFSDKYEIDLSCMQATKKVENSVDLQYDFQVHQFINSRFNAWCGRSFIAFACQVCLIIVITCAFKFINVTENTKSSAIDGNLI